MANRPAQASVEEDYEDYSVIIYIPNGATWDDLHNNLGQAHYFLGSVMMGDGGIKYMHGEIYKGYKIGVDILMYVRGILKIRFGIE